MKVTDNKYSWTIWALAAFVLFLLVAVVAAPRMTEEFEREEQRLRSMKGLAMAESLAASAAATGGKVSEPIYEATLVLWEANEVERAFFIDTDRFSSFLKRQKPAVFVYDSGTGEEEIGDADKHLSDAATRLSASVKESPSQTPSRNEMFLRGRVVLAPAVDPVSGKVLGVAGVVLQEADGSVPPLLLWGVVLALLAAFAFLLARSRISDTRLAFSIVAGVIFMAQAIALPLVMQDNQARLAEEQAMVLERSDNAFFAAAPDEQMLDFPLVWDLTWSDEGERLVLTVEGGFESNQEAAHSRGLARAITPLVILFLGLLLAAFAIRGTAELLQGMRSQPTTYLYILPVLLAMAAVIFYPFLKGVEFAFLDANAQDFVGLANFEEVLVPSGEAESSFYRTAGVTVMWTALNVILHVSIGLALALLLNNKKLRFKGLYRVLLVVPWAMPNYITALTWKTMFNTQYGAVNILLKSVGIDGPNWFGPEFITNFSANLSTNVWLGFPFMMVVSLGALQSIPTDLYEAADIDGAGRWQKFRSVTLPLLKPALFPAIILGTIWTFNQFNVIYLVSGGGPDHKTEILITEAYYLFKVLGDYGQAAAYCLMIFLILLVYTVMTNRITRATEGAFE